MASVGVFGGTGTRPLGLSVGSLFVESYSGNDSTGGIVVEGVPAITCEGSLDASFALPFTGASVGPAGTRKGGTTGSGEVCEGSVGVDGGFDARKDIAEGLHDDCMGCSVRHTGAPVVVGR